jgi:hypothetical protein
MTLKEKITYQYVHVLHKGGERDGKNQSDHLLGSKSLVLRDQKQKAS